MRTPLFRFACLGLLSFCLSASNLYSQAFTEQTTITLTGIGNGSVAWGDFDNDGDQDILLTGYGNAIIYRNTAGVFGSLAASGLTGVSNSSAAWGDYDNDGDLDILLTGSGTSKVYRNDAGTFVDINAGLTGVNWGSVAWGDYDNDGDLDIMISGYYLGTYISMIYRNDGGVFTNIEAGLTGVSNSSVAWGDYDNDGDLDILIAGYSPMEGPIAKIYRNDNGFFTDIDAGLEGVSEASVAWGDYDRDGDLDILLTGYSWNSGYNARIYNNDGGIFTDIGAGLTGVQWGSVAWGDYDNDGDLDILLTGYSGSADISKIYSNSAGSFTDISAGLTGVQRSSVAWGDYDNDGDLDILLTGSGVSKIYKNNSAVANTVPAAPSGLGSSITAGKATPTWNKSTDTQTSQNGLSYNIYIGTAAGTVNKCSPMAAVPGGYRKIVRRGNIQSNSCFVNKLPAGTYYWSVQAIDNCFAGSAFAAESTFTIPFSNSIIPTGDQTIVKNQNCAVLTVTESSTPTSRQWKYSTVNGGPYSQSISGATGTTCITSFPADGIYYIVCESTFGGTAYTSNQVKIVVTNFIEQTGISLTGVYNSSVAWGDYDNDGDLDILLTGTSASGMITKIYTNGGSNTFTELAGTLMAGVDESSAAWGDYDNDGDLDILLTGYADAGPISEIWTNNGGGSFVKNISVYLPGVRSGSVAWADYDNDGDLDILLTGYDASNTCISRIYRNDAGVFTDINAGIRGARVSSVDWGDYDNDGDLDILIAGYNDATYGFTRIYRNDNGSFTVIDPGLSANPNASVAWGDYDNDGDLDILLSCIYQLAIYKNNNGVFSSIYSMPNFYQGTVAWGDYDNDGDLDFLVTGTSTSDGLISKIIQNNGNDSFSEAFSYLEKVQTGSSAWGDYDNDGDLDLLLTGSSGKGPVSKIYKNNNTVLNTAPTKPSGLIANVSGTGVTLSWSKTTDTQTPQDGLSYNLYIGTASGTINTKSPMAGLPGGYRRIVQRGLIKGNNWVAKKLTAGTYYWSVQAIDNNFAGSAFATESSFTIAFSNFISPDTAQTLKLNQNGSVLTVTESSTPTSRQWKYSMASGGPYDQIITGATGTTYTPNFSAFGTYYVVCVSTKNAINYTTNEVKIMVPAFTVQTGISLIGVQRGSATWGDYDGDGDLDILLTGSSNSGYISQIYRNDLGVYNDISAGLTGVGSSAAAWGDYDNDGDLDLLLTGYYYNSGSYYISKIYRNDAGVFTDINAGLTGVQYGSVAWGDYDNDGDLDVLLTGEYYDSGWFTISKVYRNDAGVFTDINAGLTGVSYGSAAWGDYDNDGDLDILLTGSSYSKVYRNDNGSFTDINAGLTGTYSGSVAWGDYDSDGDLDILLTGSGYSKIYNNNAGVFTDINAGLTGISNGNAVWGDYDNDGDLDVLLTGAGISKIYRNDGGVFTDIKEPVEAASNSSAAWGDYDNDGDLDILLTGSGASDIISKIYKNNSLTANVVPTAPSNLQASLGANKVTLSWNKSTDTKTAQDGLTYNIYIGTTTGSVNKKSPMAALPGGYRRIVQRGFSQTNSWTIKKLIAGTYYWSVQAIDNNFAGSAFATEGSFTIAFTNSVSPEADQVLGINQNGAVLTVTESSTPASRQWKYSTVSGGPYDQSISGATATTYTPNFAAFGTYYVVCVSIKNAIEYTTNEVKIIVPAFAEQTGITLPGVDGCSVVWGDYDSDGDLDILLTGYSNSGYISRIYRNDLGVFNDINAGLTGVSGSAGAWGDYDNDGDLDLLLTGGYWSSAWFNISKIYKNDGGTFTDIGAGLTPVSGGSVAWGDYDNDGDLDILLTGDDGSNAFSKVYRNDAGVFTDINAGLTGVSGSDAKWGDYDNDGDLDILLTGSGISKLYRNDNGVFTDINAGLQGTYGGSVAWGDYDSDGDLDILLSGWGYSKIYNNNAGIFTDINAGLTGLSDGSAVWGDLDNDGDLDIILNGYNGTLDSYVTRLYRNDTDTIIDMTNVLTGYSLAGVSGSSIALGDYDNDGDLDVLIAGYTSAGRLTKVYKNNTSPANTVPTAPSNLQASLGANKVTLSWNKSTDTKTAQAGLTYNVYVGTTAGSVNKKSPMAALPGGYRRIVQRGTQTNSWTIKRLLAGTYYWSVQAIDNNFAGSAFATEGSFTVAFSNSIAPVADQILGVNQNGTALTVTESSTPTSRQWKYSTVSGGPYDQTISGATGTTYTPNFSAFGTYYVVCVSTKSAIDYTTNEVKISVPAFTEQTGISLTGISDGSVVWGDYDNDGDLDILLSGYKSIPPYTASIVYRNDLGAFTDINAGLTAVWDGCAAWGDYDNDGDLDILLTGYDGSTYISKIYRNDAGTFTDINAGLTGLYQSSVVWGDYDNDGDLDILLTGNDGSTDISKIYRNDAGVFTDINAGLPGVRSSSVAWGDYDNDGDLDILLAGSWGSWIYRNDNGIFTDINAGLTGIYNGSVAWGDYDSDGDLDILLTGWGYSKIYNNNAGIFTEINAGLTGLSDGSAAWGDFDNDGDLDIIMSGYNGTLASYITRFYRNDTDTIIDITNVLTGYSLAGAGGSSVAFGDYDNDGDLDVLIAGYTSAGRVTKVYKNNTSAANTVPTVPTNLQASLGANKVTLSWNKSTDTKTDQAGLTYNVYIGTTAGSVNKKSPMAALPGGYRRIVQRGAAQTNSWTIKRLLAGTYYWSVQAIDNNFAGSAFATEGSFTVAFSNSIAPVADQILGVNQNGAVLTVTESSTPTSRQWKYSTVSGGPYDQTISGATATTYTPNFAAFGTYYVVCVSTKNAIDYATNEVKISVPAFAEQTGIALTGVHLGSATYVDYDNDGDLDILVTGSSASGAIANIYRNDLGVFNDISAGLTGVYSSSDAWGDYDNDGDPDLLLTGYAGINGISKIYRNDAGIFTDIDAGLTGVWDCSAVWGDYDNDGDLDILLTGYDGSNDISKIYRNDAGVFTDINAGLTGVSNGSAAWGDYDNDGDLDILLTGNGNTKIYRNDNGVFTDINASLSGDNYGSAAWGDYDSDGDLDILLTGWAYSKIYNNNAGVFTEINAGLKGMSNSKAVWGDLDNDGDLDIILSGYDNTLSTHFSRIYRNDTDTIIDITNTATGYSLASVYDPSVALGDYDNDGDLDILLTGGSSSGYISKIYKNNSVTANVVPTAPSNLQASVGSNKVTLTWNKSTDTKTAQAGLTYNIYIGTTTGSVNRRSPMAAVPGGYRRIVQRGLVQTNSWTVNKLSAGTYYWSVQALDNNFAGSAFATEGSFAVTYSNSISPVADQSLLINQNGTVLTVTESSTPTSRQWKYSTVSGGPYDKTITGATGTTFTPKFSDFGVYYIVCVSTKNSVDYTSNEVRINVPAFTEQTGISLVGINDASVAWGDYDNDGDLDILLSGYSSTGDYISRIYRNDAGVFTDINAGLTNLSDGSVAWGDFDNDGDLDILLTGDDGTSSYSKIYRNNAGVFTDINAGLTGVTDGSAAWGDYDNDGDLDILLTGWDFTNNYSKIYRNDAGVFTDINANLTAVRSSSVKWGDYDNDGDLDILLIGYTGSSSISKIYRNDAGVFTNINTGLTNKAWGSASWGDYDNDGDLDILLTADWLSLIYTNNGNDTFSENGKISLKAVTSASSAWGDFNNDGYVDILLTGYSDLGRVSKIYRNDADTAFSEVPGVYLDGIDNGSVAWGDYDNDGDLDIVIAGYYKSKVYKNNSITANTVPSAPTNLVATALKVSTVSFTWNKATDSKTPQNTLTYNIRIGTSAGGSNIVGPMASTSNGFRRVPAMGNAEMKSNGYKITGLAPGKYYWSVQAIDQAYAGGAWATEGQFYLLAAPVAKAATNVAETSFTSNWSASTGATGYKLDVATDSTFTTIVTGYNSKDVGNVTSANVSGLTSGTIYYYRLRAYDAGGTSIVYSNVIKAITLGVPIAPVATAATNVVQTSFTANWNSSPNTTSYKLDVSTSNTFSSFVTGFNNPDVGNVTTYSVTGLTANTAYYYRVRANNSYGVSSNSNIITVTTLMNPPAAPAGLTASSCLNQVTLSWTAISDANFLRYIIYGGTSSAPTTKMDSTSAISTVTKTLSGLTPGATYYFRVTAVNTAGMSSSYSSEASVIVKKGVVPKIKAKWSNVLICYNIGDSLTTWQWYKAGIAISGATKQYYVTSKQAGSYYVVATDKSGCQNPSNTINITGTKSATVYPNPASKNVTVSISGDGYGRTLIRFYNSNGIKIIEYQTDKQDYKLDSEIGLAGLESGTYTIEVIVDDELFSTSRIVIIK
jgi:FG-GAP-like repeat/Secretion system C-terminal sorting domain/Fibronectin type III domain